MTKVCKYTQIGPRRFLEPRGSASRRLHASLSMRLAAFSRRSPYREAAATGTLRSCKRCRTSGTSGYSRTAWPRRSRTAPSLRGESGLSGCPPRPAPASPAPPHLLRWNGGSTCVSTQNGQSV